VNKFVVGERVADVRGLIQMGFAPSF